MNGNYDQHMGWGMHFMGLIFWIFIIVAVVLLVRWLMSSANNTRNNSYPESAQELLNKRYARGEIDRDTYESMKKDLDT